LQPSGTGRAAVVVQRGFFPPFHLRTPPLASASIGFDGLARSPKAISVQARRPAWPMAPAYTTSLSCFGHGRPVRCSRRRIVEGDLALRRSSPGVRRRVLFWAVAVSQEVSEGQWYAASGRQPGRWAVGSAFKPRRPPWSWPRPPLRVTLFDRR